MIKKFLNKRVLILSPLFKEQKGEHLHLFTDLKAKGYVRLRINGQIYDISELPKLDKNKKHNISVLVDQLIIDKSATLINQHKNNQPKSSWINMNHEKST